jgi:hypothetical protein
MALRPGTHRLGPADGRLTVHTRRAGAAAMAGHDLALEVTRWEAVLVLGRAPSLTLTADAGSLRVAGASGGVAPLGDGDRRKILRAIDDRVLHGRPITFTSTRVRQRVGGLEFEGELELVGVRRPVAFELTLEADGRLRGTAAVRQTDWRIKPYSALMGTLKVADVVEVSADIAVPVSRT